jgi:hypothetical protein
MNRHYYISNNLDDLEKIENELQQNGIDTPQIHVYSRDDTSVDVEAHHLHEVSDFSKRDVVHSGLVGFAVGSIAAIAVLLAAHLLGWTNTAAGWIPFIFLAIVIFGFSAWEGGLRGIQETNHEFTKFQDAIDKGKHIFFVDVDPNQEDIISKVVANHPQLEFAGDGAAAPGWLVHGQTQFQRFIKAMP